MITPSQVHARQVPVVQELAEFGQLLCSCRTLYDPGRAMIACDSCAQWFHGDCAGLDLDDADDVSAAFVCPACLLLKRFPPESPPDESSGDPAAKERSKSRAELASTARKRSPAGESRAPATAASSREAGRDSKAVESSTKRARGRDLDAAATATASASTAEQVDHVEADETRLASQAQRRGARARKGLRL